MIVYWGCGFVGILICVFDWCFLAGLSVCSLVFVGLVVVIIFVDRLIGWLMIGLVLLGRLGYFGCFVFY